MATKKKEDPRFSKAQLLASHAVLHNKDVLQIVLRDGEYYSLQEVEDLAAGFLNREVE